MQQCRAEIEAESTSKNEASQAEVAQLRVELAEWKEKFEKLNKRVQIFLKDD